MSQALSMPSSANAWAIVVAAGKGRRFGSDEPKQFTRLGGKPIALWSVETFEDHPSFVGVTLVVPSDYLEAPPAWLDNLAAAGVSVVTGGAERTDSVRLGLLSVPNEVDIIAVHDGARPLITRDAITRVLERVGARNGAVAARRVTDSLKEVDADGRVVRAVDREQLWRAETPQAFPRELIIDVHRDAEREGVHASDCAALCERYGVDVVMVEIGDPNPKITHQEDFDLADALLRRRESAAEGVEKD